MSRLKQQPVLLPKKAFRMHQTGFAMSPIQSATDFLDFFAKDPPQKNK
jgi:hypothetical protein